MKPIAEVGRGNRYVSALFYAACYFISSVAVVNLWSPPQTSRVRVLPHRNFIRRPSSSCLLCPLVAPLVESQLVSATEKINPRSDFHSARSVCAPPSMLLLFCHRSSNVWARGPTPFAFFDLNCGHRSTRVRDPFDRDICVHVCVFVGGFWYSYQRNSSPCSDAVLERFVM